MISREALIDQRAQLVQQHEDLIAQIRRVEGALLLCESLLGQATITSIEKLEPEDSPPTEDA